MKKYLLVLFNIFIVANVFSQTYCNEWINFDQKYLKLQIAKDGIYRINYSDLNSAMAGIGVSLSSIDPRNLQIFNKGDEQYIFIEGENDGSFDASDYIEFFGQRNDGTFDTNLFDSAQYQLQTYESIISDTSAYFLTWNTSVANRRLENMVNVIAGAPSAELYNIFHSLLVFGSPYGSGNFNYGPSHLEVFSSKYENGEGFTSYKINLSTYNQPINTPNIYSGASFTPTLKTAAIGTNEATHDVVINFNGENYVDSEFYGYEVLKIDTVIDNLAEANTITFVSGPTTTDYQRYSYIDITYPHLFDFDNASKTKFELPVSGAMTQYLELTDLDEKSTSPLLYDLTAHKRIEAIVTDDISKYHLPYNASGNQLFVSSQDVSDIANITSFIPVNFIDYSNISNQADYIIISDSSLFDLDGTNYVDKYREYRAGAAGGSYNGKVIDINQLYDQFSYGIKKHPLAVRNFLMFAVDSFNVRPEYVFLIGKSYSYDVTRPNLGFEYTGCLVPTFGHPGADNLLAARPGSVVPEIAIGRISARTADEVRIYLDKVEAYETQQASAWQTVENKAWMKNVLHFAGGITDYEQGLFDNFLHQYGAIISDTLYGANITYFNKLSTDPIFIPESEYIDSLVNSGVSLITFFGHSSTGSFDYNIGAAENFDNEGKYFTVFGNGCNTAAIHGEDETLAETYIFEEHKAAVAFIAASNYSIASSLHNYALTLYHQLSDINYHNSIGNCIKAANDSIWPTYSIYDQMTAEHTTLLGDPALNLNNHPKPDYDIEAPYVYFEPDIISAGDDSFYMHLVVTNLGMAIDTSYFVDVKRTKPDGTTETFSERFDAPNFRDTVVIAFETDALGGVGLNSFDIHVDNLNEIDEIDEMNNILGTSTYIISDDAFPIYPVEFSIMNHVPEYFAASTSYVFADEKQYIIEVDTTTKYNSPLHQQTHVIKSGGVIYWTNPPETWINNTVYYWRISLDTIYDNDLLWRSSSFLYLPGDVTGWNQSHYFQYLDDEYDNIKLKPSRKFEFVPDVHTYEVTTGVSIPWYNVTSYKDGEKVATGSCASNGFVCFVVDKNTGNPWLDHVVDDALNIGAYGDVYCSAALTQQIIQFNTVTPEQRQVFYNFLMDSIPDSNYLICYSNGYPSYENWDEDEALYGYNLFDAFAAYGATEILAHADFIDFDPYIFYAKKGAPATAIEIIGEGEMDEISASFSISGFWNAGTIETPLIGPAVSWDKAQWSLFSYDLAPVDLNSIDVIGVNYSGSETTLDYGLQSGDTTLADIDATEYPFLKLKLNSFDDSMRTPAQFNYWRVIYTPVPEAALNPNMHFVFYGDTVQQGEQMNLEVGVTNVSDYNMDSLLISFNVRDQNNFLHNIPYLRQDSLLTDETMISTISFNSGTVPAGKNTLIVEVNPANDQPEQFHFNNLGYLPFYNAPDIMNPLLDVTFDDVHILDGDIVSAKPFILISLKDENKYLALKDTSYLSISIKYPDETIHDFYYDGTTTKFYPADTNNLSKNNTAHVEMYPVFEQDGIYELQVYGEDVSGNKSGDIDYRITFEVINKAMISNVVNYPNPFTSQTRFVFTLTGSEVPDYFKIQIMTVSGKIIREIMKSELGELHVGNNITDFAWDGTDKFGDAVANGLYLYRVVTRLNGQSLEKYNTNTDQYFKSGFGKMYLVR